MPQFILKGNHSWLVLAGFAALLFIAKTVIVSTSAQGGLTKRVIDNTVPSHVPLKIKLKKDKEEKVKDRENKNWAADLELEVTNTSNKPIYFLKLYILMPEILSPSGAETGFPLSHGRHEFIYPETRPVTEDIPIRPGERDIRSKKADNSGNQFAFRAKFKNSPGNQLGRWAWDVYLARSL